MTVGEKIIYCATWALEFDRQMRNDPTVACFNARIASNYASLALARARGCARGPEAAPFIAEALTDQGA